MRTSQKLMRLPRVTNGSRTVCLRPTVWAPLASSSRMVPPRTCAPDAMFAPARKTASWAKPPLSLTPVPSWQSWIVMGVSSPSTHPAEMTVRRPRIRHPGPMTTPSPLMLSTSTSSSMSTVNGLGMRTPLSMSLATFSRPRGCSAGELTSIDGPFGVAVRTDQRSQSC